MSVDTQYYGAGPTLKEKEVPTPEEIIVARKQAKLSAAKAAALVYVDPRTWRRWEAGDREMPEAAWELFNIKTKK